MLAVLTGDIINSREGEVENWLPKLKSVLNIYGNYDKDWGIYRGDSFQLKVHPPNALKAAIHIKAAIKQANNKDVRIGIGIGQETHSAQLITESNGSAYVYSGSIFEALKKQTLAIKSDNAPFDESINVMLNLALLTANNWSSTVAEVITTAIEHPNKNQKSIAALLNKSQSNVSSALKRGGFETIMQLVEYYKKQTVKP